MLPRKLGECHKGACSDLYLTACINDSVSIRLFTDDCLLYKAMNNADGEVTLNKNLSAICDWCDTWEIKLNEERTEFMRITNKKHPLAYQYTIKECAITETDTLKYFGATTNNRWNWSKYINNVCTSAQRKLSLLRHKLKHSPSSVKLLACNTLVRLRMKCACVIWAQAYVVHEKGYW